MLDLYHAIDGINLFSPENREDLLRYLLRYIEALFYLIYTPRAKNLLQEHLQR
jgi:sucrose synthase